MTMQSTTLLPALRELPGDNTDSHQSFREIITGLVNTDRAMYAAESAAAVSFSLWGVFDHVNVDDRLFEAYKTRWPVMSEDISLHDKVQEMLESGELSLADPDNWLFNGLKGQLAEFKAVEVLEQSGFTNVTLAHAANHPMWDIIAIDTDGKVVVIQSKTGDSYSAGEVERLMAEDHPHLLADVQADVQRWMEEDPEHFSIFAESLADSPDDFVSDVHFAFSSEILDKSGMDAADRIVANTGSDYERVDGIKDGLGTLSDNMGIDIPDGMGEIIPYAAAIIAGTRLIHSVVKTEREFEAADRNTKNKIQVMQTLTLMSRVGITTVLATVGGMGGGTVGSAVPGVGNLIGGVVGSVVGAGVGMYLNRHLQPRMLDLALNITGLTHDDLFYYKNKTRIDQLALRFNERASVLTAAPA